MNLVSYNDYSNIIIIYNKNIIIYNYFFKSYKACPKDCVVCMVKKVITDVQNSNGVVIPSGLQENMNSEFSLI